MLSSPKLPVFIEGAGPACAGGHGREGQTLIDGRKLRHHNNGFNYTVADQIYYNIFTYTALGFGTVWSTYLMT